MIEFVRGRASCARMAHLAVLAALVSAIAPVQYAVAQTPSAAQMEAFKNLPADQQQAILEEMGGGTSSGVRRDRDLSEPRIRGNDTVLLEIDIRPLEPAAGRTRTPEETKRLEELRERAQRGNPFRLDAQGQLRILGVAPIPLAGLTEAQATERLIRDPVLRDFEVKLTLLPLEKLDAEALKPFGYDLFAGVPSTFAPVTDVPVPSEYVVGPGDRLEVQLIGNTKGRHSLVVNRDGRVNFPELGPIAVRCSVRPSGRVPTR